MDAHDIGCVWSLLEHWDFTVERSQHALLDYFKALVVCCNADGNLTDEEREWCVGYCAASGGTEETLQASGTTPVTSR